MGGRNLIWKFPLLLLSSSRGWSWLMILMMMMPMAGWENLGIGNDSLVLDSGMG